MDRIKTKPKTDKDMVIPKENHEKEKPEVETPNPPQRIYPLEEPEIEKKEDKLRK